MRGNESEWLLEQLGLKKTAKEVEEDRVQRNIKRIRRKVKHMNRQSESILRDLEELEEGLK